MTCRRRSSPPTGQVPGTGLELSSGFAPVLSHHGALHPSQCPPPIMVPSTHHGALHTLSDVRMLDVRLVSILTPGNGLSGLQALSQLKAPAERRDNCLWSG